MSKLIWKGDNLFVPRFKDGKAMNLVTGQIYDKSDIPEHFLEAFSSNFEVYTKPKKEPKRGDD